MTEQTMKFEKISPQTASQWLAFARGQNFRELNPQRAMRLADAIKQTGWKVDGNAFKFNSRGILIDGQHRASAIVKLGLVVEAWVCRGVDETLTIDTGQTRTLPQILKHQGERHYSALASVIGGVWRYQNGQVTSNNALTKISISESLVMLNKEPDLRASAVMGERSKALMSAMQVGTLHFIASRFDKPAADLFVEKLISGAGLSEEDPVFLLRRRLLKNKTSYTKLTPVDTFALLIKAWNLWYTGKSARILRWTGIGPNAMEFPKIVTSRQENVWEDSND